jgi:hypothetical protein
MSIYIGYSSRSGSGKGPSEPHAHMPPLTFERIPCHLCGAATEKEAEGASGGIRGGRWCHGNEGARSPLSRGVTRVEEASVEED